MAFLILFSLPEKDFTFKTLPPLTINLPPLSQGDPQAEKTPRFNFDIKAVFKCIGTPETPLDVLFSNALQLATENIKNRT
jgi:hypothetical protein